MNTRGILDVVTIIKDDVATSHHRPMARYSRTHAVKEIATYGGIREMDYFTQVTYEMDWYKRTDEHFYITALSTLSAKLLRLLVVHSYNCEISNFDNCVIVHLRI